MFPKTWEQGRIDAFSISPSERGRLKGELHIVQCWVVPSCALADMSRAVTGAGVAPDSDNDGVGTRSKVGLSIVGKWCREIGQFV